MKVYIDGLPRSGNVFFAHCFFKAFGPIQQQSDYHKVDTLKNYKNIDGIKIIVLRDAMDSLVSCKVRNIRKEAEEGIEGNNNYEGFVKRHEDYIELLLENDIFFIAPFKEFTVDPDAVMQKIKTAYPDLPNIMSKIDINDIFETIRKGYPENSYDVHLPEEKSALYVQAENHFKENYMERITVLQEKIDSLYERYYHLPMGQ